MFIVYGAYHFWPKKVGFRDDYCLGCQAPRRSIAIRTLDVGHIFWIPILPVGFWKRWRCSMCNRDPRANTKTGRSFKWIGLVCLFFIALVLWTIPVGQDASAFYWGFRFVSLASAVALLIHLIVSAKEPSLRQRLAAIPPASDTVCPFCSTPLLAGTGPRWSCPACNAERY
jgi:hypothetical protein